MAYDNTELQCYHLRGERGVTAKIKQAMQETAKQFVYIGFLLWEVKEYEYYYEDGYNNVYQYAEYELGFKRSSTKNFIAICENFCRKDSNYKNNPTMFLDERWSDYQYSQLTEMLAMSPAQRQETKPNMTVKQLREIKKPTIVEQAQEPEKKNNGQTSGQIELTIKWTSVNKGLPEHDKRVLVCCETKAGAQNINLAYFDGTSWHGNGSMAGVTHWMELPNLPKIKRNQEALQAVTINNFWDDIAPETIARLCKTSNIPYRPNYCYDITIKQRPKS